MTNANEMAEKGFNTGFTDAEGHELHVGDYIRICNNIGKIVFSCGAFGILFQEYVPWDALEELVRKKTKTVLLSCTMTTSSAFGKLSGT